MDNPIVEYFRTFSDEYGTYEDKSQSGYSFNDWVSMLNNTVWAAAIAFAAKTAESYSVVGTLPAYSLNFLACLFFALAFTLGSSAMLVGAEAICQGWRRWFTIWPARFVLFSILIGGGFGVNYLVKYLLEVAMATAPNMSGAQL